MLEVGGAVPPLTSHVQQCEISIRHMQGSRYHITGTTWPRLLEQRTAGSRKRRSRLGGYIELRLNMTTGRSRHAYSRGDGYSQGQANCLLNNPPDPGLLQRWGGYRQDQPNFSGIRLQTATEHHSKENRQSYKYSFTEPAKDDGAE